MRIGNTADWTRCEMDELRPDKVSSHAFSLRPPPSHPRRCLCFDPTHRLRHRFTEGAEEVFVARHRVKHAETFWRVKVYIVADASINFCARRQLFARRRMSVFSQGCEGIAFHIARKPEQFRREAMPLANDLLLLRIVILALQPFGVVRLCRSRAFMCQPSSASRVRSYQIEATDTTQSCVSIIALHIRESQARHSILTPLRAVSATRFASKTAERKVIQTSPLSTA